MGEEREKQRTTVSIYGQNYTIVGYETPTYVTDVANFVDEKMREIKRLNPYLDTTKLAVLTALNVVDDYKKLKVKYEQLIEKRDEDENNDA